jgi:REP element-mobilizing transposase RayT
VHVTLRVARELGSLRRRAAYHAIRQATLTAVMRGSIRIVHCSIQRTHIHLLVEAANQRALSEGMQRFQVSAEPSR